METWTAKQLAAAAGIAEQSGRDLVRRLRLASVGRDTETGAKLYDAEAARVAIDDTTLRPGQGTRTDLKEISGDPCRGAAAGVTHLPVDHSTDEL